jgi:hypothetical protein
MDHMTHEGHRQAAEPHADSKMSGAHGNHDRHAGHSVAMFRDKFWLSFALTIPVIFWSTAVQNWLGYTAPSFPVGQLLVGRKGRHLSACNRLRVPLPYCARFDKTEPLLAALS